MTRSSRLMPALVLLTACLLPAAVPDAVRAQRSADPLLASFKRPDSIPFPVDNPYTPEKAALGKMLFFDTRLSRDGNLNCATCHNPTYGWEVPFGRAIGAGGKPLGRHTPTVINLAWTKDFFWDGRAGSLEEQAGGPIQAPAEMDLKLSEAVQRLQVIKGYQDAFARAFGAEGITEATILKAIATYERTVVTADTLFDRWIGGDENALPESAKRGFALFTGKANCSACHSGWNFTDDKFHDIGLASNDEGRMGVTRSEADRHAFKTPGLREIAARAPYMHDGGIATLEAVIAYYMTGGIRRPTLAEEVRPLALSQQEITDLLAFLRSLSSQNLTLVLPNLPSQ